MAQDVEITPNGLDYNGFLMQKYFADGMKCDSPDYYSGAVIWRLDPDHFDPIVPGGEATTSGGKASISVLYLMSTGLFKLVLWGSGCHF